MPSRRTARAGTVLAMPQSRIRVYLGCSLDGCVAGPEHDLSFLERYGPQPDADVGQGLGFETFLEEVGALLMGRRTYEVLLDFDQWPYGQRPVLVATHRDLPSAPQGGIARRVEGDIQRLVAEARAAAGDRDVYLDGGDLVRQALDAGLVDELCLTYLPVVLGRGIRLWEGLRNTHALRFEPPVEYAGRLVQVRARMLKADLPPPDAAA